MCKFSSQSGGVPFQISFFLGDLTRNDPLSITQTLKLTLNLTPPLTLLSEFQNRTHPRNIVSEFDFYFFYIKT